jgi:hypothetical protein
MEWKKDFLGQYPAKSRLCNSNQGRKPSPCLVRLSLQVTNGTCSLPIPVYSVPFHPGESRLCNLAGNKRAKLLSRTQKRPQMTTNRTLLIFCAALWLCHVGAIADEPVFQVFFRSKEGSIQYQTLASNKWSQRTDLGGTMVSAPSAVSWGSGRFDIFARSQDGAVHHKHFDQGKWSNWNSLGGSFRDGPSACSWGPGRLDVFVRGKDDTLQHNYFADNKWSDWRSLEGELTSAPAVTASATGRIDVVAKGYADALYHISFNGNWSIWRLAGAKFMDEPAICSTAPGQLDVFVRGSNGDLQRQYLKNDEWSQEIQTVAGSIASAPTVVIAESDTYAFFNVDGELRFKSDKDNWSEWISLPGVTLVSRPAVLVTLPLILSEPAVDSWGKDRIEVVALGQNKHIYWKNHQDGVWSRWIDLGGQTESPPTVCARPMGAMDVFIHGTDNALLQKQYDGTNWTQWMSLGGRLASGPQASVRERVYIEIVALAETDRVFHKRFGENGWSEWNDIGGPSVSEPSIAAYQNRLNAFYRGSDNGLWHRHFDGTLWSRWRSLGGNFISAPRGISGGGRINVVVRGPKDDIQHIAWKPETEWSGWESLGGKAVSTPAICSHSKGQLKVFYIGADNALRQNSRDGGNWSGWVKIR